mmetsp:Transcript_28675/g.88876  ORF Transcript_28675/g.88876 Transcript_28675/m.88876 type:complete len:247 (-) Transcript_28675:354-1094(-)
MAATASANAAGRSARSVVLPPRSAVAAARAARRAKKAALKTGQHRLLLATAADALADAHAAAGDLAKVGDAAELALAEFDAVDGFNEKRLGKMPADDPALEKAQAASRRVRTQAGGCAAGWGAAAARLGDETVAVNAYRDASNRFVSAGDCLRAGQCALAAAKARTGDEEDNAFETDGGPGAAPNKDDYVAAAKLLNMALEVQALKEPDLVRGYTEGRRRKVPPFLDRRPVPTEHPRGSRGGAATR